MTLIAYRQEILSFLSSEKKIQQQREPAPQLCFINIMDLSPNNASSQNTSWATVHITVAIIFGVMAVTSLAWGIFYLVKSSRIMTAFSKKQPKPATNSTNGDIESAISRLPTTHVMSRGQIQKSHPTWTETNASSTNGLFVVGSPTWSETGDDVDDETSS